MMRRGYRKRMERKKKIAGMRVVGIDPAGEKHQAVLLDEHGIQIGRSFSFPVSYEGYTQKLWKDLLRLLHSYGPENLVFAVETSCALWKSIADYLSDKGYTVLLVSPLTTYHSRPVLNHDFSKSDPKDALIIATNAKEGGYSEYRRYDPEMNALHRLSITYEKLLKDRQKAVGRLQSVMQEVFPEYLLCVGVDSLTSLYLLENYMLPQEFLHLSIEDETHIRRISNGNHGKATLHKIRVFAEKSIGLRAQEEKHALRLALDAWIMQIRQIDRSQKKVAAAMIALAKKNEYFAILTSLKGVSDLTASRFIAECRDLNGYTHYKQIEKIAGANVRIKDSGKYQGTRRISKIGNRRLLRLLYLTTTQVVKYIPEVRNKFLRRQLQKRSYRKNIVACIPWLLKLLMALIKEKRPYVVDNEALEMMKGLDRKYAAMKKKR